MQQATRSEIDIEVEAEAKTEQDVACMLVVGNSRIPQGAQKDSIDLVTELGEDRVRQCLLGGQVVVGTVGKPAPLERRLLRGGGGLECRQRRLHHFGPDTIAGDHGDAKPRGHRSSILVPQARQ